MEHLGIMLQTVKDNPHATLLTLFMNAVPEIQDYEEGTAVGREKYSERVKQVSKFLMPVFSMDFMGSPSFLRMIAAACHFGDFDAEFDK